MAHRIDRAQAWVVRSSPENQLLAAYIEEQRLIEPLRANVAAEFDGVLSNHFAEVIGPLKRVPRLRQLPFKVVAEAETTGNIDERYSFFWPPTSRVTVNERRWTQVLMKAKRLAIL